MAPFLIEIYSACSSERCQIKSLSLQSIRLSTTIDFGSSTSRDRHTSTSTSRERTGVGVQ